MKHVRAPDSEMGLNRHDALRACHTVLPIFQAGHEGSIPFARSYCSSPGQGHDHQYLSDLQAHALMAKCLFRARSTRPPTLRALSSRVSRTIPGDFSDPPPSDAQRSFGRPLTPTSSTNPCEPWKSSGLAVYKGNALLAAVAAIIRSEARLRG
jgi:hypothetical protein